MVRKNYPNNINQKNPPEKKMYHVMASTNISTQMYESAAFSLCNKHGCHHIIME